MHTKLFIFLSGSFRSRNPCLPTLQNADHSITREALPTRHSFGNATRGPFQSKAKMNTHCHISPSFSDHQTFYYINISINSQTPITSDSSNLWLKLLERNLCQSIRYCTKRRPLLLNCCTWNPFAAREVSSRLGQSVISTRDNCDGLAFPMAGGSSRNESTLRKDANGHSKLKYTEDNGGGGGREGSAFSFVWIIVRCRVICSWRVVSWEVLLYAQNVIYGCTVARWKIINI